MEQAQSNAMAVRMWAVVIGVIVGSVGTAFREAATQGYRWFASWLAAAPPRPLPAWVLGALAGSGLVAVAVGLTRRLAPEGAGSGIQEIEGTLAGVRPPLKWGRILVVKFIGGLLAITAGLILGREGPTIHMGGAVGAAVAAWGRRLQASANMFIAAGSAAGLAVAFNAPIGGALFAMEELRTEFAITLQSGQCVLLATVSAVLVSGLLAGPQRILPIAVYSTPTVVDLLLAVPFGMIVGGFGVFLNKAVVGMLDAVRALTRRVGWLGPALLTGAFIGALVRLSPELTGGGEEFSIQILAAPQTAEWLLVVLLLRTVIFPISYASGTPGGIFAPQLAFGALLGLLYGFAVGMLMPQLHLEGGRYAVSGMAALLTATVRAPLTGLALVVEMTGNYPLTLMALLTSVVADVTATLLAGKPVYETLLARTIALEGHPDDQHAASR